MEDGQGYTGIQLVFAFNKTWEKRVLTKKPCMGKGVAAKKNKHTVLTIFHSITYIRSTVA